MIHIYSAIVDYILLSDIFNDVDHRHISHRC